MRNSTPLIKHPLSMMRIFSFTILFSLLCVSSVSFGQLLTWNTVGNAGTETTEPSTSNNANISASSLNFTGSSVTPAANGNRFGGSNWGLASLSTSNYIQFTVTPNSGYSFTATSLVFIWDRSSTGPQNLNLRSSADGYVSNLGTLTGLAASNTTSSSTITISGLSNITTAITFRLYGWGATGAGGTGGFDCANGNVTSNVVLNGTTQATVTNYSFAYNANGGTGSAPANGTAAGSYSSGTTITVGTNAYTRTGYTFNGWNTAANGTGSSYTSGNQFTLSANTTLYAQWLINTYTVAYSGNGSTSGTPPSDPNSPYNYGSNVTVLGQGSLVRTGYTFDGWNTASDGSGADYAPGGTITAIAASVTLYAKWILANSYSVTYFGNGSTGGDVPEDGSSPYTGGSNVTVLGPGTLVRTGYTFSGWNTAANGSGTAYSAGSTITGIAASVSLYAQWTINTYTVTYEGNTNTNGDAPVDGGNPHNYNTNVIVLGAGTLTKTNYNFTGWNTAANGTGTAYAAGATITGIAANITLYAQWAIITYTVTYDANTGTGTAPVDASSPYSIGSTVTVLSQGALLKTGYSFAGWNTLANGSGTAYAAGATITNLSANTILYAQWTINTYTVTYNGNGNTGGTVPVDALSPYSYNSTVTVLTNSGSLVKTNSSFVGWNTAANGTGIDYAATGSATFTLGAANVVLYAKWSEPLYESFSYTVGETIGGTATGASSNNWTNHSGTGPISVTAGSLSYTGLQTSTGNKVRLPGANGTTSSDVNRAITLPSGSTVGYYSFLLSVADNAQLNSTGDYFAGFAGTSGGSGVTALFARLFAKSSGTGYQLGITNNGAASISYNTTDLTFGTTYFIVVKYDLDGANNDIATLWVNPSSLGSTEPLTGSVTNSISTTANSTFASVFLRNSATTPKVDIDELRAGPTYASVTPSSGFTITATAQTTGGSISPAGAVSVTAGADQTFTITPEACNDIIEVIVDGETALGPVTSYTFTNVSANHTIDVYFNPSSSTTWTGLANTNWNDAGNWSSCLPDENLAIIIAAGTPNSPVLNTDVTLNSLTINDGATLSLSDKTLTINGGFTGSATSTLTGSDAATLILNSSTTLTSSAPIRLNKLVINGGITTLASAVEISGGTATVDPGEVSVLSGAQLESNGFLTIKSNIFGTARVAAGDDAGNYITGDVTVERYIPANAFRSWRFLAVPTFGSQTIRQAWQEGVANPSPMQNNLAGFGTIITGTGVLATAQAAGFDNVVAGASLQTWGTSAWTTLTSTNSPIQSLKGYMLFVRGGREQAVNGTTTSATVLRTKGQLYQGTQTLPALPASSFSSVGNLYASAIDFTLLPKTGGTRNLFYIWDSKKLNGTSLGAYQTFSATNGFQCTLGGGSYTVGQVNTKIESGQAFLVSTTASQGTISLIEGSKITDGANLGFRPVSPASLVKIDSRLYAGNSTEIVDANVVVFNDKYSNEVADEDAVKMTNPAENFAIAQAGKALSIEGRHTIDAGDEIVFNTWNLKQQAYSFEFVAQNMDAGLVATLEDGYLKTSTPVNLGGVTTVNFMVDANPASAATNRFKIVVSRVKALDNKESFTIAPNPVQNGLVNVVFKNKAAGKYAIRILTTSGQAVMVKTVTHTGGNATQTVSLPASIGKGTYTVEIVAPGKTRSTQTLLVN